jgi:hypothetical protein
MIVIRLEMWPGGREENKYELGTGTITNVGTGTEERGQYRIQLLKCARYAKTAGVWKRGVVLNFPRQRLGPWDLLLRCLIACCGDRSELDVTQLVGVNPPHAMPESVGLASEPDPEATA